MISKSGGARMMEAAYSLMQLAKHLLLAQLAEAKLPYICTDPNWRCNCLLRDARRY
jgi:acetyl-CoA carboxylase carboxyl transferase subunit beta